MHTRLSSCWQYLKMSTICKFCMILKHYIDHITKSWHASKEVKSILEDLSLGFFIQAFASSTHEQIILPNLYNGEVQKFNCNHTMSELDLRPHKLHLNLTRKFNSYQNCLLKVETWPRFWKHAIFPSREAAAWVLSSHDITAVTHNDIIGEHEFLWSLKHRNIWQGTFCDFVAKGFLGKWWLFMYWCCIQWESREQREKTVKGST